MKSRYHSNILPLTAAILVSVFMLASCGLKVSKGDVNSGISKGIHVGSDKAEIIKYLDSLEVNGVKPVRSDYIREAPGYTVIAPDGKTEVEAIGKVSVSFSNGVGGGFYFCESVVSIFYFDRSDKLITWVTDC